MANSYFHDIAVNINLPSNTSNSAVPSAVQLPIMQFCAQRPMAAAVHVQQAVKLPQILYEAGQVIHVSQCNCMQDDESAQ